MKKIYYLFALVGLLSACEANTPPNNAEDKGHDEAHEVVLTFTPGTLASEKGIFAEGFTPAADQQPFTIQIENDDDEHHHSRAAVVEGNAKLKADTWYKLHFNLINHNGKSINSTILNFAEQRSMHQFFFITLSDGTVQKNAYVDYRYGDTDEQGKLYDTPIGMTGYIKVSADLPANSVLRTVLVHITPPGSKLMKDGNPYPFNRPDARVLSSTDLDFKFAISVEK